MRINVNHFTHCCTPKYCEHAKQDLAVILDSSVKVLMNMEQWSQTMEKGGKQSAGIMNQVYSLTSVFLSPYFTIEETQRKMSGGKDLTRLSCKEKLKRFSLKS